MKSPLFSILAASVLCLQTFSGFLHAETHSDTEPEVFQKFSTSGTAALTPEEFLDLAADSSNENHLVEVLDQFRSMRLSRFSDEELEQFADFCEKHFSLSSLVKVRAEQMRRKEDLQMLRDSVKLAFTAENFNQTLVWLDDLEQLSPQTAALPEFRKLHIRALNLLAVETASRNLVTSALEKCNTVLAQDPENAGFYAERGFVYLKNPTFFPKAFDLAKKDFTKALSLDPENEYALLYQGIFLREVLSQPKLAELNFKRILEKFPHWTRTLNSIVQTEDDQRMKLDSDLHFLISEIFYQMSCILQENESERAVEYLYLFKRLNAESVRGDELLCSMYFQMELYEKVIQEASFSLMVNEKNLKIRKFRAESNVHLKKLRSAKADYDYLLEHDSEPKNQYEYYMGLVKVYEIAKQFQRMREMEMKAYQIKLDNVF